MFSCLPDSSNRRSSMRLKYSKEKSDVISSVEELNAVCKFIGLPATRADDILAGNFPWSFFEEPSTSQGI